MLEDTMNYQLMNQYCLNFEYGDQTHCEKLYCVGQLERGLAGYLLNHPHKHENINLSESKIFKKINIYDDINSITKKIQCQWAI